MGEGSVAIILSGTEYCKLPDMHVRRRCPTYNNLTYMDGIMLSQVIVTAQCAQGKVETFHRS